MNRPKIASATIIPKLTLVLEDDISQLDKMLAVREKSSEVYAFIESLKVAKQRLLGLLPYAGGGVMEVPVPAQLTKLKRLKTNVKTGDLDSVKLSKIFHQLEVDQFKFAQRAADAPGLPQGIRKVLQQVLKVHQQIVDQLQRSYKTQQMQPIVL